MHYNTAIRYYEGEEPPEVITAGTMWYDTSTDILYQYIQDVWIQING